MKELNKNIVLCLIIISAVTAYDATSIRHKTSNLILLSPKQTAHISPEIINDLKDFENLIPTATVDEIVAKHYLVDGGFRTAFKYLRSQEFAQLQKQLLNVPEIIDVLEFLHLTTANGTTTATAATTRHMGATKMPATATIMASLEAYNVDAIAVSYNRTSSSGHMTATTNTSSTKPKIMAIENVKETLNNLKVPKRAQQQQEQFHTKEDNSINNNNNNYFEVNAVAYNEQPLLVRIVLFEDVQGKAKEQHTQQQQQHHHHHHYRQYNRLCNNCYQPHSSLGTFTTFVEEILQHLPNAAYQNMIKDKCSKNPKFAKFYRALRSDDFKPLIEQIKLSNTIKDIIKALNANNVDVNSLEPIAFKVISWGPNI